MPKPDDPPGGVRKFLLEPSLMHDGLRLADLLLAMAILVAFMLVRLRWDTDWAMLGLVIAPFAAAWSRSHLWQSRPAQSDE